MTAGVVIPTRFNPPTLKPLLRVLDDDGVRVVLLHSETFGHELYRMWNYGVHRLRDAGIYDIAIFNDDIVIAPGTVGVMSEALRTADPNVVLVGPEHGDRKKPAIPNRIRLAVEPKRNFGYAFMFKGELALPEFDEAYHIHQSDIIWENQLRELGYDLATIRGLTMRHLRSYSVNRVADDGPTQEDHERMRKIKAWPPVEPPAKGRRYTLDLQKRLAQERSQR